MSGCDLLIASYSNPLLTLIQANIILHKALDFPLEPSIAWATAAGSVVAVKHQTLNYLSRTLSLRPIVGLVAVQGPNFGFA